MLEELNKKTKLDWRECRVSGQVFANCSRDLSYWLNENKHGVNLTEAKTWVTIDRKFHDLDAVIKYINTKESHHAN